MRNTRCCGILKPMTEQWMDFPGWEDDYQVSDLGRVYSKPGLKPQWRGGQGPKGGRILLAAGKGAYARVTLNSNGEKKQWPIHRMVAHAFLGPCPPGMVVRHKDGNSRNNRLSNLEYGTQKDNVRDQIKHGTHRNSGKIRCKRGHFLAGPNLSWTQSPVGAVRRCIVCRNALVYARAHGQHHNESWIAAEAAKRYRELMRDWEEQGLEEMARRELEHQKAAQRAELELRARFGDVLPKRSTVAVKIDWCDLMEIVKRAGNDGAP